MLGQIALIQNWVSIFASLNTYLLFLEVTKIWRNTTKFKKRPAIEWNSRSY